MIERIRLNFKSRLDIIIKQVFRNIKILIWLSLSRNRRSRLIVSSTKRSTSSRRKQDETQARWDFQSWKSSFFKNIENQSHWIEIS